jgi:O-methyltransferase domain/Dimerisation domain
MSGGPSPAQVIAQMASGYWVSQAIYVAAKLGIADRLETEPKTASELASECGVYAPALYRLLRALASLGLFAEGDAQRFQMTPLAQPLRSDAPDSQRAMVLMTGEEQYEAWGELLYSVTTGQTGFERRFGMPLFDYLAERREQAALFDAAMVSIHGRETAAMLAAYDFSQFENLADLGGGNGSVLMAILQQHPRLRGILFDLPNVAERTYKLVAAAGLIERCAVVGGSFFETAPSGADAYLLRHIIHDWDDEKSLAIFRSIRRASPPGAKLLLVETVIEPGNAPSFAKLLDLTMLVIPGGQERTASEYDRLLAAGGFKLERIVPTTAEVSILEAIKA